MDAHLARKRPLMTPASHIDQDILWRNYFPEKFRWWWWAWSPRVAERQANREVCSSGASSDKREPPRAGVRQRAQRQCAAQADAHTVFEGANEPTSKAGGSRITDSSDSWALQASTSRERDEPSRRAWPLISSRGIAAGWLAGWRLDPADDERGRRGVVVRARVSLARSLEPFPFESRSSTAESASRSVGRHAAAAVVVVVVDDCSRVKSVRLNVPCYAFRSFDLCAKKGSDSTVACVSMCERVCVCVYM